MCWLVAALFWYLARWCISDPAVVALHTTSHHTLPSCMQLLVLQKRAVSARF